MTVPGPDSIIALRNVWKGYGGLSVLKDVSIELRRGEVHMLLGENGAGKSTLVGLMIGAHGPDKGDVVLHGRVMQHLTPHAARRLGVNAVLQDFSLAPTMTVAENYALGREEVRGPFLRKAKMRREAQQAIEALGLALHVDARVENLSRPEQQLLEIVRALSGTPGALILDEPTATLSHDESEVLFRTVEKLRREGWAILYITHRLDEVHRLGDRITVLRDGTVAARHDARSVDNDQLIRDMVGRPLETFYPEIPAEPGATALALVQLSDAKGRVIEANLQVRFGEIVGIGGLVGCGKGEVGALVFGLDPVKSGRIEVEGKPCRLDCPKDALREGIVYLPQDRRREALSLNRSASENMEIERVRSPEGARLGFVKGRALADFTRSMLETLDIRPRDANKPAQDFSGGNQQKLVLARALSRTRKTFIFCEPTAGIDVGARLDFYKQLERLCRGGAAILLITSDLPELVHLSHRIYVMHAGRVVAELAGQQCTEERVTHFAFGNTVH